MKESPGLDNFWSIKSHYRECHIFRNSLIIKGFLANLTFMGLCDTCTHTPSDVRFITYKEKGSGQSTWIGGRTWSPMAQIWPAGFLYVPSCAGILFE